MPTISNTPRPGYAYDSAGDVWYPIGTGPHTHSDYITQSTAINPAIVDAKGDIIAATAADSVARLAVGSNDQVLTADSSTATGLKWATPSSGGMTLISTTTLSGATTTISGIPSGYNSITLFIYGATNATSDGQFRCAPNNLTNITTNVRFSTTGQYTASGGTDAVTYLYLTVDGLNRTNANNAFTLTINNYANSSFQKTFFMYGGYRDTTAPDAGRIVTGTIATTSAITSLVFSNSGGDLSTGTVLLYGVK